jgi:glycosyltransferase involved in cell wall biosynthesis
MSPRVLLIAEAANPEWASVPLGGWSLSRAIAKVARAHTVTQIRNTAAFNRAGLIEGVDFSIIDNESVARPLAKVARVFLGKKETGWTFVTALQSLGYYSFEKELWRRMGPRLQSGDFDIVHRITPKSPTTPSIIAKKLAKLGIPFVIGPLGGGVPWPKGFTHIQHAEKEWLSHVRWLHKLLPGHYSTLKYCSAIIVGSKYNREELPDWAKEKSIYIPGNGIDPLRFNLPRTHTGSLPLRAAFVGRLVPYKGGDMLIEASHEFIRSGLLELHVIGDGPEKAPLEKMAKGLNIADKVKFHGWLPHQGVQDTLRMCDLFTFPSIREFGGAVVIEAMSLGLVPIVADYAGPPEFIDDTTGIKVPFNDRTSLVAGMREAIGRFVREPSLVDQLGSAARKKVSEKFTWDAKATQILPIYDAVLAGNKNLQFLDYV